MENNNLSIKYFEDLKKKFLKNIDNIQNSYIEKVKLEDEYKNKINKLNEDIKNKNETIEELIKSKNELEKKWNEKCKEMKDLIEKTKNNESKYKENDFQNKQEIYNNEYGTLYYAFSSKDNIDVCLKQINIEYMEKYYNYLGYKDINCLEHLNNESELRKSLSFNENCVKFYGEFQKIEKKVIVFEKCDEDLENFIKTRKKSLNEEEIKKIFIGINKIFEIMNDKNIIHRDLKLKNFLIKYTNKEKTKYIVKLSDFGIGKFLNKDNYKFNWNKPFETVAPEIFLSKIEKYEKSVDIYSLGIILYQLSHNLKHPYKSNEKENLFSIYEKYYDKDNFNIIFSPSIKNRHFKDLVENMIKINPKNRIKWEDYFKHDFFKDNINNKDDYDDYYDKKYDDEEDKEKFYDFYDSRY